MPKSLVRTKQSDPEILLRVKWTEQPYSNAGGRVPTVCCCKWCELTFATKELFNKQHDIEAKACRGGDPDEILRATAAPPRVSAASCNGRHSVALSTVV